MGPCLFSIYRRHILYDEDKPHNFETQDQIDGNLKKTVRLQNWTNKWPMNDCKNHKWLSKPNSDYIYMYVLTEFIKLIFMMMSDRIYLTLIKNLIRIHKIDNKIL